MNALPILYHVALESYNERYTSLMSIPGGWLDSAWQKCHEIHTGIDPKRIVGGFPWRIEPVVRGQGRIKTGQVLDAVTRSVSCGFQVINLIEDMAASKVEDPVIFLDDFWTPGIESLAYIASVQGQPIPKIYAYCWAQSVDEFDFTYSMREWIRFFERGCGHIYTGIFVACPTIKSLLVAAGFDAKKIHVVGLPFDSERIKKSFHIKKDKTKPIVKGSLRYSPLLWDDSVADDPIILFSSRFDKEKNPLFFLEVMEALWKENPKYRGHMVSGAATLRSNDPAIVEAIRKFETANSKRFKVSVNLTKPQYYTAVQDATFQFNCADQDFVSFTLLDALTFDCIPIYPRFRSFPETFGEYGDQYLYQHGDVNSALRAIHKNTATEDSKPRDVFYVRESILKAMDDTAIRMYNIMFGTDISTHALPWDGIDG